MHMIGERLWEYASQISQSIKQLLVRPLAYYQEDTALHTLIVYAGIKIIVLLCAVPLAFAQPFASPRQFSLPFPFARWDSLWYVGIAREGYAYNYPNSAVFPPVYPFLIKVFSLNNPAIMPQVAWLIANAFSFLGLYFLYKLVPSVLSEQYRLKVCFAYMIFPVLLVCNLVVYSEPLFLAFTIGSYYFWRQGRFGFAALFAILSIFTRQLGALIILIFVVDMLYELKSGKWARLRLFRQLAVISATGLSVGGLYLFYYYIFGDLSIVQRVEAARFNNVSSISHLAFNLVNNFTLHENGYVPVILISVLLTIAAVLFLLKRDLALSAYSLASLVAVLSTNTDSLPRYIAAIFPLYLFFGLMLSDDWKKNFAIGVIAVVIAIQNLIIWIRGFWLY